MEREDQKYMAVREYSRVDANVPLAVRVVPPEEKAAARSRFSVGTALSERQDLPDLDNKVLTDWMKMLNAKLDTVLSMLSFQRDGFGSLPSVMINISAGGVSFTVKENFKVGDLLEMKVILPLLPPVALYLYGDVVKMDRRPAGTFFAVKFSDMDEDIRDQIVKFVFRRQRDILREKRR